MSGKPIHDGTGAPAARAARRPPFDSSWALRRDPYRFIRRTARATGADAFPTRLLLERALCLTGVEAARFFYDRHAFTRVQAAPEFLRSTLFGAGGVQGLDGAAHHHRKALFLQLFGPGQADALTDAGAAAIRAALTGPGTFALQDRMEVALTDVVCAWAGVPLPSAELPDRSRMISNLFEHAAPVEFRHLRARVSRRRADRWAGRLIAGVRAGDLTPPPDSALAIIARWSDTDGTPLPEKVAAVELLNALRPFVAISAFLTFAGHALATCPGEAAALRADPTRIPGFVQEVRRTYPFFPLLVARARHDVRWRGHEIPAGRLVALDIWGTNRDPAAWHDPDIFDPERFRSWPGDPYTLIPQGGGDHAEGHRCPGEWVTRDLMEAGVRALVEHVDWRTLPDQDLSLDMRNLPGLPRDRLRLATP